MVPIIVYVFFAITQVHGVDYGAAKTMDECTAERKAVMERDDALFVSECKEFTLMPLTKSKT